MSLQSSYPSHSAQVDIELRLSGAVLPVSQLGPGFLILTQATDGHPPTNARLFMQVDDSCEEWPVRLPEGIRPNTRQVILAPAD